MDPGEHTGSCQQLNPLTQLLLDQIHHRPSEDAHLVYEDQDFLETGKTDTIN